MATSEVDTEEGLAVGMEFDSVAALRRRVEEYCVEDGFSHRKPINRTNYLKVECTSHVRCPFMIRASGSSTTHTMTITTFVNRHSVILVEHSNQRHRQSSLVSHGFLVRIARDSVRYGAGTTTPVMVKARALQDHGLSINCHAAWRALQSVYTGTVHHNQQSYQYIDSWLSLFTAETPGTVIALERDEDNAFRRICLVYGVFEDALKYRLPVIAVDACHLKGRDTGTLYVASTMTGRHDILIIRVAICNSAENGQDWSWFLSHLLRGVPCMTQLLDLFFISDRDKGIAPAVRSIFPGARHSHCAEHIKRNVISEFKTHFNGLVIELAKAADAGRVQEIFDEIRSKDEDACKYIEDIGSSVWITASFPVPRYGIVTSNAAEAINSSLGDLRKATHLQVFVGITQKVIAKMDDVRLKYSRGEAMSICPRLRRKITSNKTACRKRLIVPQSSRCSAKMDLSEW